MDDFITEGKEIMKRKGTKYFSQAAGHTYKNLKELEKEKLRKRSRELEQPLTLKECKQNGYKIFKNIDKQVILKHYS